MNFRSIHCVPAFVIAVLNAVILTPFAVLLKDELENSSCELTPRGKSPLRTNWAFHACTSHGCVQAVFLYLNHDCFLTQPPLMNFYREKTQGLTVYRSLSNMVEGQVPEEEEQDAKLSGLQRDRFHYHYEQSCPSAEGQVPLSL